MTTGSNKFFVFDENKVNIMDDTTYQNSLYRTNGAVQGIAPSNLHNKLYHQATMMSSAIAQVLANQGLDVSDQDFTTLVNQLSSNLGSNRVWKASTVYAAGEVTFPTNPKSSLLLICTTGGTTGATEPVWGSVGQTVTDGTVVWSISDLKASGEDIGTIKPWLTTSIPAGWLEVSTGAEVGRATYPTLWNWVQAHAPLISEAAWQTQANAQSSVGAFSTGDGSTTFRLPRIVDYVRGGILADVGTWQSDMFQGHWHANPPNYTLLNYGAGSSATGAYLGTNTPQATVRDAITDGTNGTPRVGNETRPKTVKMVYCIKAFGTPTNQGLIDITALANDVAGKQKTIQYIQVQDEKASGTAGGTFTSGAWRTRDLNIINKDDTGQVTISSNQITLPAGTYEVDISAPATFVNQHKTRLQNMTSATTLLVGTSERSDIYNGVATITRSFIKGKITLTTNSVLEVQHYCNTTYATAGYGLPTSISGVNEIYTIATFRKVG